MIIYGKNSYSTSVQNISEELPWKAELGYRNTEADSRWLYVSEQEWIRQSLKLSRFKIPICHSEWKNSKPPYVTELKASVVLECHTVLHNASYIQDNHFSSVVVWSWILEHKIKANMYSRIRMYFVLINNINVLRKWTAATWLTGHHWSFWHWM